MLRLRFVLFALAVLTLAGAALAREAPEQSVVLLSRSAASESRLGAVRAQLAELGVAVVPGKGASDELAEAIVAARAAADDSPVAVYWVADRNGQRSLFLFDPRRDQVLVRGLPVVENDAVADEQLAIIVRTTVVALLEGNQLPMEVIELSSPAPPEPPPSLPPEPSPPPAEGQPPDDDPPRLRMAGGVVAGPVTERWAPGAALGVEVFLARRGFVGAGHTFAAPVTERVAGVELRLTRHPVELFGGYEWRGRRHVIAGHLVAQLDALRRETVSAPAELASSGATTKLVGALSPRLRGGFIVSPQLFVHGGLGVEILLNDVEYVVVGPSGEISTTLSRLRPRLELGATFSVW